MAGAAAEMKKAGLQPYPAYQPSGVSWLGEIPQHWGIERAKWLFKRMQRDVRNEDEVVTCFRDGEVTLRKNRREDGFTNAIQEHGYQGIRKGDLVIHAMDAFAGAIGVSDSDGKSTPVYTVCVPQDESQVNVFFYSYLLRNLAHSGFIVSLAKGIRERSTDFRYSDFSQLLLSVPPKEEQDKIVEFIEEKSEQIDKAIAQKEKLIELLKERQQIVIQNAVTKGLNPDVPTVDSGIEWIGKIPKHWEVKRLKNVCEMLVSNVDKHSKPYEIPVRLCNYTDVYKNDFIDESIDFMEATASYDEIERFKIRVNDVLITKDSEDFLDIGVPSLVRYEETNLICGYHLAILRPIDGVIHGGYLNRLVESNTVSIQFSISANGVTRYGISHGAIKNTWAVLPPINEQEEISEYIEELAIKTKQAIGLQKKQIKKLKEYRTTLINSAVTGKIKVS